MTARVLSAFAVLVAICESTAAPPPPIEPLGEIEWEATGKYPPVLHLKKEENGRKLVIAGPFKNDRPRFTVYPAHLKGKEEWGLRLTINHRESFPLENSLYTHQFITFDLLSADVFPIYDQLYAAKVYRHAQSILLTHVTEQVPEEFRPAPNSRIISLADVDPPLFWEQHPQFRDYKEFAVVRLKIDESTMKATLDLEPRGLVSGPGLGGVKPVRASETFNVAKGDLLTARGRSYRVLNVVVPQEIQGVGKLVGWIEISADPVKPEDAEAGSQK